MDIEDFFESEHRNIPRDGSGRNNGDNRPWW